MIESPSKLKSSTKTEPTASLPIATETIAEQAKKYPIAVMGGILADECLEQRTRLLT